MEDNRSDEVNIGQERYSRTTMLDWELGVMTSPVFAIVSSLD